MNEQLKRNMDLNPPKNPFELKPVKEIKKQSYKVAITKTVIKAAVIVFLVGAAIWQINKYDIQFRSPVQNPLVITERSQLQLEKEIEKVNIPEAKASPLPPVKSAKEIIQASKHPNTIWAIYGLESSYGVNDKCQRDGKGYNGLGYGQSNTVSNCFPTFEAAVAAVDSWITDHDNMSLGKKLCLYNTGKAETTCSYYQKFLTLVK